MEPVQHNLIKVPQVLDQHYALCITLVRVADIILLSQSDLSKFPALEHCKIDLIQSKGIVFAKFSKASCALKCMEEVNETRMVSHNVLDTAFVSKVQHMQQ